MLHQVYIGCTNADVGLINLDMRFNCVVRNIAFWSTCHTPLEQQISHGRKIEQLYLSLKKHAL